MTTKLLKNAGKQHMYATVTELACKSPVGLEHTVRKLKELHSEVQHIPGFNTLYLIKTAEQTLVMVTLYASEAEAEEVSAQVRTHLGHVKGEHVSGPPRRASGEVLLPS
jgi:heme-degrading monooxygenase HmoA